MTLLPAWPQSHPWLDSPLPISLLLGEEHQGSKGMSPQQVSPAQPHRGLSTSPAPSPHGVSPQGHPLQLLRDFCSILGKEELLIFPSFFQMYLE